MAVSGHIEGAPIECEQMTTKPPCWDNCPFRKEGVVFESILKSSFHTGGNNGALIEVQPDELRVRELKPMLLINSDSLSPSGYLAHCNVNGCQVPIAVDSK